jgi:hypothetical protein
MSYPSDRNHTDFLLTKVDGECVPVEVGFGKKSKKQVLKSINKFDCDYGIIVSDSTSFVAKEDGIIYIPLTTFFINLTLSC